MLVFIQTWLNTNCRVKLQGIITLMSMSSLKFMMLNCNMSLLIVLWVKILGCLDQLSKTQYLIALRYLTLWPYLFESNYRNCKSFCRSKNQDKNRIRNVTRVPQVDQFYNRSNSQFSILYKNGISGGRVSVQVSNK